MDGIEGMDGILGILGMLGKLLRSVSIRLDFFLARQTSATSRAKITTVTPIAIPTVMEGNRRREKALQIIT